MAKTLQIICEGLANILLPEDNEVFYNKVQVTNRDISVLVIREWIRLHPNLYPIRIFEALAASGLRSIRYFKEIPDIDTILDKNAFDTMTKNIIYNKLDLQKVIPNNDDCLNVMNNHRFNHQLFTVIDLDPYGSPAIFLENAIQCLHNGGLLCVTATDMSVLCGTRPDICFSRYHIQSVKGKYCHEMAIRILLGFIESIANRHKKYIIPLICVSIDFYIRVFIEIHESPSKVQFSLLKQSFLLQCINCDHFELVPMGKAKTKDNNTVTFTPSILPSSQCPICQSFFHIGGPIYTSSIKQSSFVNSLLESISSFSFLASAKKIKECDIPLYYDLSNLCNRLHCITPRMEVIFNAICNAGFQVSRTHCNPNGFKTTAPTTFVYDILIDYIKNHPIKEQKPTSISFKILHKEKSGICINMEKGNNVSVKLLPTFLPNPEDEWGPHSRHGKITRKKIQDSKPLKQCVKTKPEEKVNDKL